MDINETLYRKDSNGKISFWRIDTDHLFTGERINTVRIKHGRLNGKTTVSIINTHRDPALEAKSRYIAKVKQGYKTLADVKDNIQSPVEISDLNAYLQAYLPENRATGDGSLLPMLAKAYDNTNNKIFKDCTYYFGQWKINGLRCFIRAVEDLNNLFEPIKFTFQSREGTYWNSLYTLNEYLFSVIPEEFIREMIEENIILDGELYIPGFTVNMINHAVKDPYSLYNKFVQFWCYDLYIEDNPQYDRFYILYSNFKDNILDDIKDVNDHLNTKSLFNIVPNFIIDSGFNAIIFRDHFINLGFEGLIMRDPELDYQAGKRKMIKYKKYTDGKFQIVDIIPEGLKRPDIAKFVCRNDINSECFECKLSASIEEQKLCLKNKDKYIGKYLFISYGERAGVKQVPFHIKNVVFVND